MSTKGNAGLSSAIATSNANRRAFVLQEVQPALLGLMDGSVSTLAPIFAAAGLTGEPLNAFFVGLAAALGAALSMGLSEAARYVACVAGVAEGRVPRVADPRDDGLFPLA
jgi:ammonia channel protein AmtB